MKKFTIGYVATAITPYFSEEEKIREKSEAELKKIIGDYDAEIICYPETIFEKHQAISAANFLKNKIDFLLIQTSSCSAGDQLYPLCEITKNIGLWAVPDPQKEGGVRLHSLVSTTHFLGIIKKNLKQKKIKTKWFYNFANTKEFQNKFLITLRSLIATKKILLTLKDERKLKL